MIQRYELPTPERAHRLNTSDFLRFQNICHFFPRAGRMTTSRWSQLPEWAFDLGHQVPRADRPPGWQAQSETHQAC